MISLRSALHCGIVRQIIHEDIGIKQNARERVVDFVGDARGQSSYGGDFFGLHQLDFGLLEFSAYPQAFSKV